MPEKTKYSVLESGWYAGTYRRVGEVVEMHAKQAEFYLPPYANRLRPVTAEPVSAPAPEAVKPRKKR